MTPEVFIKCMDECNVEAMCLQCIHGITDPYPGNPEGWKMYVPNEYVKKEFIDAFPGRFTAVGGVHARYGKEAAVEMVISAYECGFPGCKFHPPTAGYPNNPDLYPAYVPSIRAVERFAEDDRLRRQIPDQEARPPC